jgi:rRNA-processing protein FCF1
MTIVILDTNFIIYCVKQKIYFDEQINELLIKPRIIVPEEVRAELRKIAEDKEKKYRLADRELAELSLQITEKYDHTRLGAKYVDRGIINYCKVAHDRVAVATMDARLAEQIRKIARIIKIRALKKLIIE